MTPEFPSSASTALWVTIGGSEPGLVLFPMLAQGPPQVVLDPGATSAHPSILEGGVRGHAAPLIFHADPLSRSPAPSQTQETPGRLTGRNGQDGESGRAQHRVLPLSWGSSALGVPMCPDGPVQGKRQ